MPGGFVALFVVVVIAGVAMSAVNAGKAREIAERTGDDPGSALRRMWFAKDPRAELRQMEHEAEMQEQNEQLARSQRETNERLRRAEQTSAQAEHDDRPAAERLEELQGLYAKGLVNEDEFAEKRRDILGDV